MKKFWKVNFRKIKNLKNKKIVNASKMNRPLFENCAGLAGVFGDCCSDVFPDFYFSKFEGLFLSQNRFKMTSFEQTKYMTKTISGHWNSVTTKEDDQFMSCLNLEISIFRHISNFRDLEIFIIRHISNFINLEFSIFVIYLTL
jgi:hypothetical protein